MTDENDFVDHGTNNIPATEDAPWFYIRTDEHTFQIKEREGSPGSYTYFWQGPFVPGSYESRIVYSAQDNPGTPNISWNATNTNFNISNSGGADWAVDTPNPKWWRLISLPRDSNTAQISPNILVGSQTAEQTPYVPPTSSGNIPSSVDNVEEALNVFHNATLGGSGGSLTQQPSDWNATSGVTRILNKPIVPQVVELTNVQYFRPAANPADDPTSIGGLSEVGDYGIVSFNINQDLLTFSSTYNTDIFIEANCEITVQAGTDGTGHYAFDARTGAGNTFQTPARATVDITNNNLQVSRTRRASGNIPRGTTSIQLRVTVTAGSDAVLLAGVDSFRAELRPDIRSDEILINHGVIGNNIDTANVVTLDQVISQFDKFPIQPSAKHLSLIHI